MVQLNVYMYALASIASEISEVKTETVPTGLGGVYGNKGKDSGAQWASVVCNYRFKKCSKISKIKYLTVW